MERTKKTISNKFLDCLVGVSLQFHLSLFSVIVFLASCQTYWSLFIVFTPSVFLLLSQLTIEPVML